MGHPLELSIPDGLPYIDFAREFDHPVAEVFRAHADPELYARWIGPRGLRTRIEQHDVRTGGAWAFAQTPEEGGEEYGFRGTFHTVRRDELVVQTFEYLGAPDAVDLEFLRFEDLGDGRCRLVGHTVHASVAARDAMAASGMEDGMTQGYERLDELLAELAGGQGG
ncbi:SRPBCC family protein [Kocuria flava]|uniref:SRPBCC family protein n=1 Tax=Kocuria flava TaxID=446860 RepID=UPI001FF10313|nr:SRPBCC family protein [Kocuria flava]MCJ8504626.1 SRPBCC family protein [Kocuria flava]